MHSPPAHLQQRLVAALTLHRKGELDHAEKLYRDIIEKWPDSFDARYLLGIALSGRGATDEGIALLRGALAIDSNRPDAHMTLARAHLANKDYPSALESLARVIEMRSELSEAWLLRGNILLTTGRPEESVQSYERVIQLQPDIPEAYCNLSAALRALRRTAPALECAERALALRPEYAMALNNRGLLQLDGNRHGAAVEDFQAAISIAPDFAEALHNLGTALMQLWRFDEAGETFARLATVAPGFAHVQGNLLHARLNSCDWTGFSDAAEAVARAVADGQHADLPFPFLCVSDSALLQLRCATAYTSRQYPLQPVIAGNASASADARIRVAYLSGDFGEHAVTYLLAGVLERHDRSRFDVTGVSWGRQGDGAARRRIESAFPRFIDVTGAGDAEIVRILRALDVDIAVDLTGLTFGHRTGVFSRRAAPVQVNYLGFPATMGAPYLDYIIADQYLIPAERRGDYTEKVVLLPCFQPNDDRRDPIRGVGSIAADGTARMAARARHGLPIEGFVFCSFNSNFKFNPDCFDVWIRLLTAVPGSVLWLYAGNPTAKANLRREAMARGMDGQRLVFAGRVPYREYLERYLLADLFLDTFPFNGGTTVSDALSMALPVISRSGSSFASRMAGSLLCNLGLGELAFQSFKEYEATALELAASPQRLQGLRSRLAAARTTHPFFDTDGYRRSLESAYEIMWRRSAAGLPAAAIDATAAAAARRSESCV
jgi:predicted O-linked N-acetylglucosamine transferase (SPINDLY family)